MDKNIYHVPYVYGKMDGRGTVSVRVPGSKSITNRGAAAGNAGRWAMYAYGRSVQR